MRTGSDGALCGASYMIRSFGLLLLLITAAMGGNAAAKSLEARVKRLRTLEWFCEAAGSELKYLLPTVKELLCSLAARADFQELVFLRTAAEESCAFPESWRHALETDKTLCADEREILRTVGSTLGSTELSAQLSALKLCCERLRRLREAAESEVVRRGRLYRSMGILTGIFLVILLL